MVSYENSSIKWTLRWLSPYFSRASPILRAVIMGTNWDPDDLLSSAVNWNLTYCCGRLCCKGRFITPFSGWGVSLSCSFVYPTLLVIKGLANFSPCSHSFKAISQIWLGVDAHNTTVSRSYAKTSNREGKLNRFFFLRLSAVCLLYLLSEVI